MARMSLSAVVLCRQRLRPPPSMEQSEGSGCADSPPSSHVATAVISGLQTLLLFAVACIRDHRRHQRTISSAPVPCRLRTAASTMAWHPRSQRNYRMASDDDCETESRPRRHAKFSFRARLRSRRFFVGGNDAALCLAGPHLPGHRRLDRAGDPPCPAGFHGCAQAATMPALHCVRRCACINTHSSAAIEYRCVCAAIAPAAHPASLLPDVPSCTPF